MARLQARASILAGAGTKEREAPLLLARAVYPVGLRS